nr:hypothetical protein [Candidatus Electrothrix aestuarii]
MNDGVVYGKFLRSTMPGGTGLLAGFIALGAIIGIFGESCWSDLSAFSSCSADSSSESSSSMSVASTCSSSGSSSSA